MIQPQSDGAASIVFPADMKQDNIIFTDNTSTRDTMQDSADTHASEAESPQ